MGIIGIGFFLLYIGIVLAILLVVGFRNKRWRLGLIILVLSVAFPFYDYYSPRLSFYNFCTKNLKYVNKLPIQNVEGFYSESERGTCAHCYYDFFKYGYKYIEARISKDGYNSLIKTFDKLVEDDHKSLYRFTLVAMETDEARFNCKAPNITLKKKIFKRGNLDKILHVCIKAQKIQSIQAPYLYSQKKVTRHIRKGSVIENTKTIRGKNGVLMYSSSSFTFYSDNFFLAFSYFPTGCSTAPDPHRFKPIYKLLKVQGLNTLN